MTDDPGRPNALPTRLVPGDRIGVVAPSSCFDARAFWRGVARIRDMGFHLRIPDALFEKKRYLAGDDGHRAGQIHRMFADPAVKAVFCARGGFGASRVLDHIDWPLLCRHPKIFVGFSDVSVLLSALAERCGMAVFHGPVVTSLGESDAETLAALKAAVASPDPVVHAPARPFAFRPGVARGRVAGGNLCTLCHLAGTPFAPKTAGRILFLEECGEPPYRIDRMLTHLRMCGWFDAAAGIVLGTFERCGDMSVIRGILQEAFVGLPVPVLGGLEAGHGVRNLTLPMGVDAVLDADRGCLTYCGPATSRPGDGGR